MIGDELDIRLDAERAKLEAFSDEVRRFFDQLSQEVEAEFSSLMDRMREQQPSADSNTQTAFMAVAQERLQQRWQNTLPGMTGNTGPEGLAGQAFQGILSGISTRGRGRGRNVVHRLAGVLGVQLGRSLANEFTPEGEELRLSRAQQALEQDRQLSRAARDR